MSNYNEIITILNDFFNEHIDRLIGDLTLNEIIELVDDLDNIISNKRK